MTVTSSCCQLFFPNGFVLHPCKLIIHFLFITFLLLYADELEKKA